MEIDNIRFAMMEIFSQYKQGKISQEVAEYFVAQLDNVQREKNVQNLSQIIYNFEHAEIDISFDDKGSPYIWEEEHSKLVRESFFMDQGDKYPIYLGDLIKLKEDITDSLVYFLNQGFYFPTIKSLWSGMDYEFDKDRFFKLSKNELNKYRKYINDLISSCSVMKFGRLCSNNIEQKRFEYEMIEDWQKYMIKNSMAYRIDAYNLISRNPVENGCDDEERE